jgi:acetyl-CoA carboxylase carboxyl transferase subunit beta
MEWFTKFVRPKLISIVEKTVHPQSQETQWKQCTSCKKLLVQQQFIHDLSVCRHCEFHHPISPQERFNQIFDDQKFEKIKLPSTPDDPLKFRDRTKYSDKLKQARKNNQTSEDALAVAHGFIDGLPLVVAAFNFSFIGGSMGTAVGAGLLTAAEFAINQNAPLLTITSSGGARLQEGPLSLLQLPRSVIAVKKLKKHNLPYIVLLTHPTTGGVSASFAMLGDIHIAEPKATIGFAGRRVIEQTVGEQLSEDFQTSEFVASSGMIDMVVHRHLFRDTLASILKTILLKKPHQHLSLIPPPNKE